MKKELSFLQLFLHIGDVRFFCVGVRPPSGKAIQGVRPQKGGMPLFTLIPTGFGHVHCTCVIIEIHK